MDDHNQRARHVADPNGTDRPQDETEPHAEHHLGARIRRIAMRAGVTGLVISMLIHLILWGVAASIYFANDRGQLGGDQPAPLIEFAVMTETELAELGRIQFDLVTPIEAEIPEPDVPAVELFDAPEYSDLIADVGQVTELTATLGGGDISDGMGIEGGAGGGAASFFGVEAVGRRFAFVVDRSGSMAHSGKWPATQQEMIRAIDALEGNSDFFIMLYSTDAFALGGRTEWREASRRGKRWARQEIIRLPAPRGGTDPVPAFLAIADGLRPRPDAIYFMTDGEFPEALAREIIDINSRLDVPIHCITFVNDRAAPMMQMIAKQSGGTYTHVTGIGN